MYHKNCWNNNRWYWRFRFSHASVHLIEYSSNYSEKTRILWFYPKDGATNFNVDIVNDNNFKSFKYKAKLFGITVAKATPDWACQILKNTTIYVPLRYLSNFWISLEISLINWKVELKFKRTKYCVLPASRNFSVWKTKQNRLMFLSNFLVCGQKKYWLLQF